jgi:hypothetical protein
LPRISPGSARSTTHYFRQRRPDGHGGWIWNLDGAERVLYRLEELIEAIAADRRVFVVEGEKDVLTLAKFNIIATCNPGGAGKWRDAYSDALRGADVIIIPDNDVAGRSHAQAVALSLEGKAARIRTLELPDLPEKGDVTDWFAKPGATVEALNAIAEAAKDWTGTTAPPPIPTTLGEIDMGEDTAPIPPRAWLLGTQFCRRFLSSVFAPGGTGKTALRTAQLLAAALGRPLTGQYIHHRCRVFALSLEDDIDEMRRRFAAPLIHYGIDRAELKGWLFCAAPKGIKIAEMVAGSRQIGALEKLLREAIVGLKPDILSLDPFVKLHAMEENDNGAMDFVADLLTKLAIEFDLAVDAPHHVRKGGAAPGDAEGGRGASGIKDAGRLVYTLTRMSEEEAKAFGVPEAERLAYVRLDNAKVNLAPPATSATWFKLISIHLGNATPEYPNGDDIQTVIP